MQLGTCMINYDTLIVEEIIAKGLSIKTTSSVKLCSYLLILILFISVTTYVTEPEKTGLIYKQYTYSYYGAYLFFRVCYPNSVNFLGFCVYIKKFVLKCYVAKMRYCILKTKQNLGQILRVDKTCFLRPGHIYCMLK